MTTVGAALGQATRRLADAGVSGAAGDARRLMAAALGVDQSRLVLAGREPLPPPAAERFDAMIAARARRQPVAQIVGHRAFWGRAFLVTPDVLDPRPETETLIAAALAGRPAARILDLGTGSGAILVTLLAEWPSSRGTGIDASAAALAVATRNAARHGVGGRADFRAGDWTAGLAGRFDLVVCNPPYIPAGALAELEPDVRLWEPAEALSPGTTGLEAYAAIARGLGRVLAPGARALFEAGAGQAEDVAAVFAAEGHRVAGLHRDLDGRARVVEVGSR